MANINTEQGTIMKHFWDSLTRLFRRKSRDIHDIYDYSHIRAKRDPAKSETKILNYVWINKQRFSYEDESCMCRIPLHYIDKAIENAKRYPDTQVRLWLDHNLLDQQSLFFVASHIHFAGADNIAIHDLNEIPEYRDNPMFHPDDEDFKDSIWARVDIARLLALQYCLEDTEAQQVFYSDFDADDVKINSRSVHSIMQKYGLVLGATTHEHVENGYFGFHRRNKDVLNELVTRSFNAYEHSRHGAFSAFCTFKTVTLHKENHIHPESAAVTVLPPTDYTIPKRQIYRDLKLNI